MAYVVMVTGKYPGIVLACVTMAYVVMAYMILAFIVLAYIVIAYIVMASMQVSIRLLEPVDGKDRP